MALTHAAPGTVVHAGALGSRLVTEKTSTLVNEPGLQIFRLVLEAGQTLADHRVPTGLVIQCLEGEIAFRVYGSELRLQSGDLCHLPPGEPHAVRAFSAASALVTLYGPRAGAATNNPQEFPS
jgi:quercetin dioxygenase-like cupin family protein